MKKLIALFLILSLFTASCAVAETAVDIIMNAGTAQAFTDEAVSSEDLNTILQAGLASASALNQQPWFFAVVTSKEVMAEISGAGGFGRPAGDKPEGAPEGFTGGEGKPEGAPEGFPGGGDMPAPPAGGNGAKAGMGDSPAAIVIYKNGASKSPNADFDCGLATQNMAIAAVSLGYGVKIVSSPTMSLNGENHDALCEKLGVDTSMQAVAVLLIGRKDESTDAVSGATTREPLESKVSFTD